MTTIIFSTLRKASEDIELGDVLIPAETFVIGNTAAANRDPAVYNDPERLDITRDGQAAMLTFGGGVHYCLGANLARIELAEALAVLARRMPHLCRVGSAPWKPINGIAGPTTLPLRSKLATEPAISTAWLLARSIRDPGAELGVRSHATTSGAGFPRLPDVLQAV